MKPMMNETENQTDSSSEPQGEGIDGIIATVDEYIQDPKLVTPETLQQLKRDLEDLKSYLDEEETTQGEEQDVQDVQDVQDSGKEGGLSIVIGKKMRGEE